MDPYIDPVNKLNDLLTLLNNCEVEINDNKKEEYKYLADNHLSLKVINKENDNYMYIDLEDEFSLFFGDWHNHFYPEEEYYQILKENIIGILKNDLCVFSIYSQNKWKASYLSEPIFNQEEATKKLSNSFKSIDKENITIKITYWDKTKNKEYLITKE